MTLTGRPLMEAFGRQISFLRAVAAGAPTGSALQLRFTAEEGSGRIRCHLLGAASTEAAAALLNQITRTGVPSEYPLEPVPPPDLERLLSVVHPDVMGEGHVVAIRRSVDRLDPTVDDVGRDDPVLFPWTWSPQAMLSSLGLLRYQPATTQLVVHLEPAVFPGDIAIFLQDEIRRLLVDLPSGEENPLRVAVLRGYRRWLHLLPQGCLSLRVMLAGSEPLVPGLAESLSTDLTRSFEAGGADAAFATAAVVVPSRPSHLDACAALLEELRGLDWALPAQPELATLMHLFDPLEANTAFRLPIAPRGGLAGIGSRRLPSVGAGAHDHEAEGVVRLGTATSGAGFELAERDLNQHVLVAGLPGFGKSSTVQLLLERLYERAGVPFLVIDPAKRDYEDLFAHLGSTGRGPEPRIHRLGYDAVAFNPLAVPEGVEAGVHAGRLIAAFDSAFQLSETWPYGYVALSRIIYELLEQARAAGRHATLRELYRAAGDHVRRSAWSGESRQNFEGALLGRLEYLACGPAGRALSGGSDDAVPWADILSRPTLIELGEFAAPAERSLVFGLLIAGLVSHREAHPVTGRLAHVTVLEEAHRVLRHTAARDSGVEVFADAIAELRGAGEGFLVVEQSPSSLHPSVLKLTGTKLVHRLVDAGERTATGASMVLDEAQTEDLARLGQRRLMAYAATGAAPSLVDVDELALDVGTPLGVRRSLVEAPVSEINFCIGCPVMCEGWTALSHVDELLRSVDVGSATADELLAAARPLVGTPAEAYCLAAASTATTFGARTVAMRRRLTALQTGYRRKISNSKTTVVTG
ncbi:MAG: ATP-binding protein [Solirubrobacterales bacterium]|nr:ATP-binding protein [Solirubrobacterales bacterium]